jgi:prepilin-type N-terminal cleavage/methylation domain-containing protein
MDGILRLRTWLQDHRPSGAGGFSLVELLVAVGILGVMAGISSLAFGGFNAVSSTISCRADETRLQRAESTYFLQQARYGSQTDLVTDGLLGTASSLHDVTVASSAYTISEVGRCIGTNTAYNIAAPTVGTTAQSGVTVAVMNPDGTGVSGAVVSYSQGAWTTMGTTGASGQVNAPIADGTYDFRVVFGGTTNTLSGVNVKEGTLVTFPTVKLTVTLANSSGPLSGGSVSVLSSGGSASAIGTTGSSGSLSAQVLPAFYNVTMTSAGRSVTQSGVSVNSPTTVAFNMNTLTVQLLSTSGTGISGGSVSVTPAGGSPFSLGTTNSAGIVTASVLDGSYTIAMTYNSATSTQSATMSGDTTVTFQQAAVTLQMLSSTGAGLSGQDSAIWWRPTGTSNWSFAGYPNSAGSVNISLVSGNYDFEARWFGVYQVQSAVAVSSSLTVTFQAYAVTEFMSASNGSGLSGQDSAIWVRPAGTSSWYFSGYPNGSGQVVQQLLGSSYDFEARWFGVYQVQSAVAVSSSLTVTFQGQAVTLSLLSSTGSGLSGQDSAIWVRPAGTSSWYFSGYPNSAGQVAQQLLNGSYDVQFRWLGTYQVSAANAVNSATTIAVNAAALNITARKTSDNGVVSGAATYVNTGGGYFFVGYTNGSGQYGAQVLVGTVSVQCTSSALTGTNSNLSVPAGGTNSTVMLA